MNFKQLFKRSLGADPGRLHFAAHSHHLWPDASYEGHLQAWNDAAHLADRKWDKIMEEIWPAAQAEVAAELGTGVPENVVFAPNTHELLVRLVSAFRSSPIRILTSDGEFHSARRQLARWEEVGTVFVERVPVEPFESFSERFLDAARRGVNDLILVSHIMFASGRIFSRIDELARLARPTGPWVVIDGYHAFMALPSPLASADVADDSRGAGTAFYLGGGYKYAMSGEGCAFMHAPEGCAPRPTITGWFAEFEDLSLPPGSVGYAIDARRFLGATFDPSALYRFISVRRTLRSEGLTTKLISGHADSLQRKLLDRLHETPLVTAELLNPLGNGAHARFLAFKSPNAQNWYASLKAQNCITDVRGNVLRIGFGLYQDEADVERLIGCLGELA
ncbi:MAG TPA: class V aminotransferase [Sphingomicrobium sp.]|nr:class V aminotransferase [Sphingomicrobium sp.]